MCDQMLKNDSFSEIQHEHPPEMSTAEPGLQISFFDIFNLLFLTWAGGIIGKWNLVG